MKCDKNCVNCVYLYKCAKENNIKDFINLNIKDFERIYYIKIAERGYSVKDYLNSKYGTQEYLNRIYGVDKHEK